MNYDEIEKSLRICGNTLSECDGCKYDSGEGCKAISNWLDLLEIEAADAIEELQQTVEHYKDALPRWISVKERLPEPGVPCLCWCKGGTYGQIRWYGLYYLTSHRTWAIYDNDYENQEVTHWMPRPTPPQEIPEMPEMREMGKIAENFFGKWVE